MTLQEILTAKKLNSALIVDDAYDDVPYAEDLEADGEAWTTFIDDLGDDRDLVIAAFPDFESTDANDLRQSDDFVAAIWNLRGKIRDELWNTLFEGYESERRSDRLFLEELEKQLTAVGVTPNRVGRKLDGGAEKCGIIFADLFLGAAQHDPNMERSIKLLLDLLSGRESDPPVVILMSRSPLLQDKRVKFRDDAKLVGALFRVYAKKDLIVAGTVERALARLANNHTDGVRVAAFLHAWEGGLQTAVQDFLKLIRRLDLSDYCQIREVLLDTEGQPLGSYLLDVFDCLLQHEIEAQKTTIARAQELNDIDLDKYPASYIAGSPDLQELVYRSIWQHPNRLAVKGNNAGVAVSFGDVLIKRSIWIPSGTAQPPPAGPDAFVVLTPACDLVRSMPDRRILVMAGALVGIDHRTWSYKSGAAKTPVLELPSGLRMSIDWQLKKLRMLDDEETTALLGDNGDYSLALRMRESNAIELQQKVLADMGRVGVVSHMPFTFSVRVDLHVVDANSALSPMQLPGALDAGVCMSGRGKDGKDVTRLMLTEDAIDVILTAIRGLAAEAVPERGRAALARAQTSSGFEADLQRGLVAPGATKQGQLVVIKAAVLTKEGEDPAVETVGYLVRNAAPLPEQLTNNQLKDGVFVIALTDYEPHPVLVGAADAVAAEPDDQAQA